MEYEAPDMNRKEKKELAIVEVALLLLGIVGVAFVIWIAWLQPSSQAKVKIRSFKDCAAAGNPIQESYPEVCVTSEGHRFTKPK